MILQDPFLDLKWVNLHSTWVFLHKDIIVVLGCRRINIIYNVFPWLIRFCIIHFLIYTNKKTMLDMFQIPLSIWSLWLEFLRRSRDWDIDSKFVIHDVCKCNKVHKKFLQLSAVVYCTRILSAVYYWFDHLQICTFVVYLMAQTFAA